MTNKWGASLYGFAELDMINDSTQSFNDAAGNAAIARPGSYAGELGRATMGVRNSRLGFKVAGPLQDEMRISGQIEVDFFGAQAATPEAAFWTSLSSAWNSTSVLNPTRKATPNDRSDAFEFTS